jgi:hypothetical protein
MSIPDTLAALTGERTMAKYTVGDDRPTRDEISRLAYQLYETRGRQDGQDVEDWLAAEKQITRHYR